MVDYAKLKNAELEAMLKERGLPHNGKKAEMVARLEEDDKKKAADAPKPAAKVVDEDEIDWDDEDEPSKPAAATKAEKPAADANGAEAAPAKPAVTEEAANPAAAEPAEPANAEPVNAESKPAEEPAGEATEAATTEAETKPAVDYTAGLSATDVEKEIEKRKARAAKFGTGTDKDAEEALKKLERAKKFGETVAPRGLDEALPERRERKRGREDDGERRGNQKRRSDGPQGGRGGRFRGRGRGAGGAGRRDNNNNNRSNGNGGGTWLSEADRKAAEARKARFAAPAASS